MISAEAALFRDIADLKIGAGAKCGLSRLRTLGTISLSNDSKPRMNENLA